MCTHLQKCLGLLRIDRIEDDQDDKIEKRNKFRPLCEETRRFVSRTNGVFSIKDWISQMSKRKTQTQVTKRSREEIENVSLNGNVDVRSSRSGGSKFEARVRNPSSSVVFIGSFRRAKTKNTYTTFFLLFYQLFK